LQNSAFRPEFQDGTRANPMASSEIPYAMEQGIFVKEQGICLQEQGI
jgi:hypothetical protein